MNGYNTGLIMTLGGLLLNSLTFNVHAQDYVSRSSLSATEIQREVSSFKANSREYLNKVPDKWNELGMPVPIETFSERNSSHFIDALDSTRLNLGLDEIATPGRAGIDTGTENIRSFVDDGDVVDNVFELDSLGLNSGNLRHIQPWSDHYWPIYGGVLGARYSDPEYPYDNDWKVNWDYIVANPPIKVYQSRDAEELAKLSPSEKYDLLVGDSSFTMTRALWGQGKQYYDEYGEVESWMGICHGWAPAAMMMARPEKAITALAGDGETELKFYPSDIKALSSLLWAVARTPVAFLGGRCNTKNPETDQVGRIKDQKCFDTNPGTWHMAVINQLARKQRSFIIDATYDYQVWNQPMLSYEYTYFNPETGDTASSLNEAMIAIEDYTTDPFRDGNWRSSEAKKIVGIAMTVKYMVETQPTGRDFDTPLYDQAHSARYLYDLELDSDGTIIGGEWYNNRHPDFLWVPRKGARALTEGDYSILSDSWDMSGPMSQRWQNVAKQASMYGEPLGKIVEELVKASKSNELTTDREEFYYEAN